MVARLVHRALNEGTGALNERNWVVLPTVYKHLAGNDSIAGTRLAESQLQELERLIRGETDATTCFKAN
jgi:hypothetical protein